MDDPQLQKNSRAVSEFMRAVRSLLGAIPFGIGSAIDHQIFDRIAERDRERLHEFIESLDKRINALSSRIGDAVCLEFLDTDEFRYILRDVLTSAAREHREEKRRCYRNILLNCLTTDARVEFDRKAFFLNVLGEMTTKQIAILGRMSAPRNQYGQPRRVLLGRMWSALGATDSASRSYIQASFESLSDKGLLERGPRIEKNRRGNGDQDAPEWIEELTPQQWTFRLTKLGDEFLSFVGNPSGSEENGAGKKSGKEQ